MVKYARYTVLAILSLFLAGCGYDVVLQYERTPSVSYSLLMTTGDQQETSSALVQAFKDEGLEPVFLSDLGGVRSYSINHGSSRISFRLHYNPRFKRAIVGIHPARLVSYSKTRANEHERRKQSLLRIKNKLEKTNVFDEYIPTAAQGANGRSVGVPPKPEEDF